jgi:hypothetical protein
MGHVLKPMMFKQADYVRNVYMISPDAGVPWDSVLQPQYWAHVAAKLKPYDEIVVVPEDDRFYGRVLVLRTGTAMAIVRQIEFVELEDRVADEIEDPEYTIEWKGPIARWRVTRKVDGMVVAEGDTVKTKPMAEEFVRELRKAMAA